MKLTALLFLIGSILLFGAGCSKTTSVASKPAQVKQALIQRRTADPPKPPEHVPLPTPVQPTGTNP